MRLEPCPKIRGTWFSRHPLITQVVMVLDESITWCSKAGMLRHQCKTNWLAFNIFMPQYFHLGQLIGLWHHSLSPLSVASGNYPCVTYQSLAKGNLVSLLLPVANHGETRACLTVITQLFSHWIFTLNIHFETVLPSLQNPLVFNWWPSCWHMFGK